MLMLGISNKIDKEHSLFFYEFDNINYYYVQEEARFLSECFGIDIYVLESSENNYHLISFDVLTNKKIIEIQNWISLKSDYVRLDEQKLFNNPFNNNCLRVIQKYKKQIPQFIKVEKAENNYHVISINHFNFYAKNSNFPLNILNPKRKTENFMLYFYTYETKLKNNKLKNKGENE